MSGTGRCVDRFPVGGADSRALVRHRAVGVGSETEESLLILAAAQVALGLSRRARATAAIIAERFPLMRRDDLARWHPFRDPAVLDRWYEHLRAAGVP